MTFGNSNSKLRANKGLLGKKRVGEGLIAQLMDTAASIEDKTLPVFNRDRIPSILTLTFGLPPHFGELKSLNWNWRGAS
jgi:hypothetical protein